MKKVVIIGAGPAGITAAFQLLKNTKDEYEIIILEESNEIGGISRTVRHNGNRMDIGGHRFFSTGLFVFFFLSLQHGKKSGMMIRETMPRMICKGKPTLT